MFAKIKNPDTGRIVKTNGAIGKKAVRQYGRFAKKEITGVQYKYILDPRDHTLKSLNTKEGIDTLKKYREFAYPKRCAVNTATLRCSSKGTTNRKQCYRKYSGRCVYKKKFLKEQYVAQRKKKREIISNRKVARIQKHQKMIGLKNAKDTYLKDATFELPVIKQSELKNKQLLVDGGVRGNKIYSAVYKSQIIIYKKVNLDVNKTFSTLKQHAAKFYHMKKSKYLAPPLAIVVNSSNTKIGYTMTFLKGYETLENMCLQNKINANLTPYIKGIVRGMRDVSDVGLTPCPEHGKNIMVNTKNHNDIVTVDLDDIVKCKGNNERQTLEQLEFIFNSCGNNRLNFKKYFVRDNDGMFRLHPKYQRYDDILNT